MAKIVDANELGKIIHSDKSDAIVLFTGSWCVDCTAFRPIWERWVEARQGPIYVLEIKRGDSAWQDWNLREIPTVAVFKDGKEVASSSDQIQHDDLERLWRMIALN